MLRTCSTTLVVLLIAACATAPVDGLTGHRSGTPTLELAGAVDLGIELVFHVEYVARREARACTRRDGESGRVVATKWLRYPVPVTEGRYALDVLLDPLDAIGCDFAPSTLDFAARNARRDHATDATIALLTFAGEGDGGRDALEPQQVDCQDAFDGSERYDCSLPRARLAPGEPLCTVERRLRCSSGCRARFDFRHVEPPRQDALWAVPRGCADAAGNGSEA
jgi:hypothetical protein